MQFILAAAKINKDNGNLEQQAVCYFPTASARDKFKAIIRPQDKDIIFLCGETNITNETNLKEFVPKEI